MLALLAGVAIALGTLAWVLWPIARSHAAGGTGPTCPQCGPRPEPDAIVCSTCGTRLPPPALPLPR